MLAFSFQAISVEGDLAQGLIHYNPEDETTTQREESDDQESESLAKKTTAGRSGSSDFEKSISSRDMLSIAMSGLARPLKSRILQVVVTLSTRPGDEDAAEDEEDGMVSTNDFDDEGTLFLNRVIHLYEICGLLLFYKSAMEKGIEKLVEADLAIFEQPRSDDSMDDVNPIISSLEECLQQTAEGFEATTRACGVLMNQLSASSGETSAIQARRMLSSMTDVHMSSPGFSDDVACPSTCRTLLSLEWITETLFDAVLNASASLDDVTTLRESLRAAEKASLQQDKVRELDGLISQTETKLIGQLVETEAKKTLELSGLSGIVDAWTSWKKQPPDVSTQMVAYPGLSQNQVAASMKDFYASLYSPPLPSLETVVKDPLVRRKSRTLISQHVTQCYEDLYIDMTGATGGYGDVSFLAHSPEQVRTLFAA